MLFSAGDGLLAVPQGIGNDPCRTDAFLFMTFLFLAALIDAANIGCFSSMLLLISITNKNGSHALFLEREKELFIFFSSLLYARSRERVSEPKQH